MEILIKIAQLLLSLSILVIFHEFGHFISAKIFKTRVEKFYVFFNPWFSLFKIKKGETEYGMGWLPLGGYVKIAGMIDESMDKEQMKQPAKPWEFRSKPAWQRLIIMLGGVLVNIFLAVAIYIVILSIIGEKFLPVSEVNKYGIVCDSLALEMGLQNGDKIISVDDKPVQDFSKIVHAIILDEAKYIQVVRDEEPINIPVSKSIVAKLLKSKSGDFISFLIPFEIHRFAANSPGKAAGMLENDRIIGLNGREIAGFSDFAREIRKYKNQDVLVSVVRNDKDTLNMRVSLAEKGLIGAYPKPVTNYFTLEEKNYNFFQAIPAGFVRAYTTGRDYFKQFRLIFSREIKGYESLGGFITIGNIFPNTWNWESFWNITAFLSIMLAILNILPIPALDGGHVMFVLYEIITRRKPSEKFLEYAQITGMIILLSLLILANGNDIVKLFG